MLGDVRLHEEGRSPRVDAAGDDEGRDLAGLRGDPFAVDLLGNGDGVEVDDAVDVVELALTSGPLGDRANVVANV